LGIAGSNFAGSQSMMINPSNIVNSKLYMDINILSMNISFQNNYIYIPASDYSFGHLISEIDRNIKYYNENNNWMPRREMDFRETNYKNGKDINTFMNVTAFGPSATYSINDQAFGFYSSFRNYSSIKNLPNEIANFMYIDFDLTK
jgi:hypothetical protein